MPNFKRLTLDGTRQIPDNRVIVNLDRVEWAMVSFSGHWERDGKKLHSLDNLREADYIIDRTFTTLSFPGPDNIINVTESISEIFKEIQK